MHAASLPYDRLTWTALDEGTAPGTARTATQQVTYELECDNGVEQWKTIYKGNDACFVARLAPSETISFRVRAVSAIGKPGSWSPALQLRRNKESFPASGKQELLQNGWAADRTSTRFVWPAGLEAAYQTAQ